MKKFDFCIVGAGLFGSCFAQIMTERGKKCLVIEKRERTGGNIATETVSGIEVHKFGAHIFHTDDRGIWEYVNRFAEFNAFINRPLASYKGKLYSLPFNMHTFYELWGCRTPAEARLIIDGQRAASGVANPANLEEKALATVGEDVYRTLIKGYTEKQWGKDCKFLPPSIIERLPIRFVYDGNYFNDRYQGVPMGGYSRMIDKMLKGSEVITGADYFSDRKKFDGMADKTVFTGAIDRYFDFSEGALEYRSLRFETETLAISDYQGNAVINYTDYDVPYTRIIEHKHFDTSQSSNVTVITREYPQNAEYGEPYYPVNDEKNTALYKKYKQKAESQKNVLFGGRLAEYKYYDMDDTVASAMKLANDLS